MAYVDGFVLPVPKKNLAKYRKMAREGARAWKRHGALQYFECVGDDLFPKMPGVKMTDFPKMARARKNETVFFSFIVYKSKAHRDAVNRKVMAEFAQHKDAHKKIEMPFDVKRTAYGGFKAIVKA